jgi:hypothetical protein
MNWLVLWAALQIGLSPSSGVVEYQQPPLLGEIVAYTQLEAEARMLNEVLFIGGMVRTEVVLDSFDEWNPTLASYGFVAGARIGLIEIGFLHVCQHPVVPYYNVYRPVIRWDGWWREFYIRLEGEAR